MLFTIDNARKLSRGAKTESRRLKKPRVKVGKTYRVRTHIYAKEDWGRIKILKIWRERLGAISDESVRREGCTSREEFDDMFYHIHWRHIHRNTHVYVIRFRYIGYE